MRPVRRRELAAWFQSTFGASCVRACRLAQFSRAAWYRPSQARDQAALRLRIRELAHARPRFGKGSAGLRRGPIHELLGAVVVLEASGVGTRPAAWGAPPF